MNFKNWVFIDRQDNTIYGTQQIDYFYNYVEPSVPLLIRLRSYSTSPKAGEVTVSLVTDCCHSTLHEDGCYCGDQVFMGETVMPTEDWDRWTLHYQENMSGGFSLNSAVEFTESNCLVNGLIAERVGDYSALLLYSDLRNIVVDLVEREEYIARFVPPC